MQADDLAAVAAISDAVHGRYTEPVAVYAERLALYPEGCRVLIQDDATGYLVSHPWHRDSPPALGAMLHALPADADSYYLHDLALLPSARGSGAGRAALDLVIAQARTLGLPDITLTAVGGADRFWARHGFALAGPGYDAECHLMRRALD